MLAQQHRMRTSVQFSETTRSGARSGRRNVVLYAHFVEPSSPTVCGFIVSKAVGNAVVRNRVRRRLRELAAETVHENPRGIRLVARALKPSAEADWAAVARDYRSAWKSLDKKLSSAAPAQETSE